MKPSPPPFLTILAILALGQGIAKSYELFELPVLGASNFIEYRGELVMTAASRQSRLSTRTLVAYDGRSSRLLSENFSSPRHFFEADGLLYFTAIATGTEERARYSWDGQQVRGPESLVAAPLSTPVEFRGSHYYAVDFGGEIGVELGRSTDRTKSVHLVHETTPGADSYGFGVDYYSGVSQVPIVAAENLYWPSADGRLHRYDGSQVAEILPVGTVPTSRFGDIGASFSTKATAYQERLYLILDRSEVPGLYVVEGDGARLLIGTDGQLYFHGGRNGAPLFVSIDEVEFYALEEGRAVPIPTLIHPSNNSPIAISTVAAGKSILFAQPLGDEAPPRWHELTRDGFIPYAPLADHGGLGFVQSFYSISFGDQIFFGKFGGGPHSKLNVIDLGLEDSTGGSGGVGEVSGSAGWTTQRPEASTVQWGALDDRSKIATGINADLVDLGGGWVWGTNNVYYYLDELPYLYDETFGIWYYYIWDDTGVYFYNFGTKQWTWFSRNNGDSAEL